MFPVAHKGVGDLESNNKTIAIVENNIVATNTIRQALTLALLEQGYRVVVLTTGDRDGLALARVNGVEVIDVGGSTDAFMENAAYLRNLNRALKKLRANVILTFTIRPAIWGNFVARLLGIPAVSNITGIGPLFERNDLAYRGARILYRFALQKTAHVFFQNDDDREIFIGKGFVSASKSERIPGSGVDTEFYAPMEAATSSKFTFLFISRLLKDKGIGEFVEASMKIRSMFPDVRCLVLGPLWEQNLKDNTVTAAEVKTWVSAGYIEYLGAHADVRPYIAAADCVVLPSYREGTSNVLLEASSMERPCITCDTTGCREIVLHGVTGYLCRVRDANDLADKMAMMKGLDKKTLAIMGSKGRQKVEREFNKAIVVRAYLNAVEEILS